MSFHAGSLVLLPFWFGRETPPIEARHLNNGKTCRHEQAQPAWNLLCSLSFIFVYCRNGGREGQALSRVISTNRL